jgi:aspartate aminotransferase
MLKLLISPLKAQTMEERISNRVERLSESATLKMAQLARQLKDEGKDIIALGIGEPDFNTPDHIKKAAIEAINNNITHYPPVPGFPELRKAAAGLYNKNYGCNYNMNNVVVSNGAKQSLSNAILSILDDGEEVVLPAPYWVSYPEMIKLAGGKIKEIKTHIEHDFKISPQQLDEALSENTRMFLFSTPSNPSGGVYCKQELNALADVFRKYPNVVIISDEIYEYINYRNGSCSLAQIEDLRDRLVVINGVSKGFAMTGWRIGYMIAPEWIAKACNKLQGQLTSGPGTISQMAALAALEQSIEPTIQMRDEFKIRRDAVIEKLQEIPNVKVNMPDGAFYSLIDVSYYFGKSYEGQEIKDADDMAMFILEKALVSMVSGKAFGVDECVRISFATSLDKLLTAISRFREALMLLENNG